MIHIYPFHEKDQHELQGTTCPCGVKVDWDHGEATVSHRSLKGSDFDATPWVCDVDCDNGEVQ